MLTTQLYRPGAHTSNLRSTSSTTARTAIPIAHYRILSKEQLAATARLVAKRSRGVNDRHDRGVAIGIASSRRAGTIALQECDRRAAGAIQRSRTAEFGRTQAPATGRVTAQVGLLLL